MDSAIQKEEIRKGIQWDGDSLILLIYEKGDSVYELVNKIEEAAEKQGLSFDEMVNTIILDYVFDQLRREMLKWIRRMEYPEENRRECEFSDAHKRGMQDSVPEFSDDKEVASRSQHPNTNVPGEDAELIDVCRYFLDHYPDTSSYQGEEQLVTMMKDWAKDIILMHERGKG